MTYHKTQFMTATEKLQYYQKKRGNKPTPRCTQCGSTTKVTAVTVAKHTNGLKAAKTGWDVTTTLCAKCRLKLRIK